MKIIPFKQKGKTYQLLGEETLRYDRHGIQVARDGVRLFITQRPGRLIVKLLDEDIKVEGDGELLQAREFVICKKGKAGQEV